MTLSKMDCFTLENSCNTHGIPKTKQITEANELLLAATNLYNAIRAEVEPDIYAVTTKTLDSTFAALLVWPSNATRATVANRLVQAAAQQIVEAWNAYAGELMEAFRKPFNDAAAKLLAGDKKAIPVLDELARVRDALALALPVNLRNREFEELSRLLFLPSIKTAVERFPIRIEGIRRHQGEFWALALKIPDVRIVWNSPENQSEINLTIPAKSANEIELSKRSF